MVRRMKPITLHPVSALLGVLGSLVLLTPGAQTIASRDRIVGYVPAEQWTYFALADVGPLPRTFIVPTGKRLVITRLDGGSANLAVNGVSASARFAAIPVTGSSFTDSGSTRVVLQPGDVLGGLVGVGYDVRVWGYLEPL